MRLLTIITFLFCEATIFASAQQDSLYNEGICDENGYCISRLADLPRPKGIEVTHTEFLGSKIVSQFKDSTNSSTGTLDENSRQVYKIKFPVLLKDNYKFLMGLNYSKEKFIFSENSNYESEFLKTLNEKPLQSLGATFYLLKPFIGNKYLFARGGFKLNGDFQTDISQKKLRSQSKYSLSLIYGIRPKRDKLYGYGLSYSYDFGKLSIYPLFSYAKNFSEQWGIELLLPGSAKLRYTHNPKNVFRFTNKLAGNNFNVNFSSIKNTTFFLEQSEFNTSLTYERELYDFLWLSASVGSRFNINFDLSEEDIFLSKEKPKVTNTLGSSLFFSFGVFIVPPRSFVD